MPFAVSWTDAPIDGTQQRNTMQHFWKNRADWSESSWALNLATLVDGEPVGSQGLLAHDFARLRTTETGSWLGQAHQQQGIGKEMRAAILHLAFAGLGAERVTSGAYHDNLGSQGVSRSLGYEDNGVHWQLRRGQPDWIIRFLLTRDKWKRFERDDIQIIGLEACLTMFGLAGNSNGASGEKVLGVDGCAGGWVVCDSELNITVVPTANELLRLLDPNTACMGIDIPIGVPQLGERACDRELRTWLKTKASSIFSPAPRLVQNCDSHADAVAVLRHHDQPGVSIQAWGINKKIVEIDRVLPRGVPDRVVEVHPEASFAAMNNDVPIITKKRTADGREERLKVLRRHFGDALDSLPTRLPGAAPDDILDAVAAMWSTRRAASGTAKKFGSGEIDPNGRPMFIHV